MDETYLRVTGEWGLLISRVDTGVYSRSVSDSDDMPGVNNLPCKTRTEQESVVAARQIVYGDNTDQDPNRADQRKGALGLAHNVA